MAGAGWRAREAGDLDVAQLLAAELDAADLESLTG